MTGWRYLLVALLCGCSQASPPSGYSDLHASPLHALLGERPTASLVVNPISLREANARAVVLSLGQAGWPMATKRVLRPEDVAAAFARAVEPLAGHVRWVGAIEGGALVSADPAMLAALWRVGVRVVGFGHTHHDRFVAPSRPPAIPGPSEIDDQSRLTAEGKRLVRLLQSSGMTVDLAHLGRAAFDEVTKLLGDRVPLLVSHTAARALCDHPRNISDAQARRIARSGGLVGVILHGRWLRCDRRPATVDDVVRHIQHLVGIMGPEHVALGTDWDGRTRPPADLARPTDLGRLEAALLKRGMPRADVRAVMHGNVERWMERLPER